MGHPKNVFKGLRLTTGADLLLEGVSDTCKKYNICINGSGEVNASSLLSFIWEHAAHSKDKTKKLEDLLFTLDLKDNTGKPLDPTLIKLIAKEATNGTN
jgi:predicted MarR family transcription regulator